MAHAGRPNAPLWLVGGKYVHTTIFGRLVGCSFILNFLVCQWEYVHVYAIFRFGIDYSNN